MAKETKKRSVMDFIMEDGPITNALLAILGVAFLIIGLYMVGDQYFQIPVSSNTWIPFITSTQTGVTILKWSMLGIGVVIFIYSMIPYFSPSRHELKKVTWPNASVMQNHSLRVFGFIILLSLAFVVFTLLLQLVGFTYGA